MKHWQFAVILALLSVLIADICDGMLSSYWTIVSFISAFFAAGYLIKGK